MSNQGWSPTGTNNFYQQRGHPDLRKSAVIPNVATRPTGVNYFLAYDVNPFAAVVPGPEQYGVKDAGETSPSGNDRRTQSFNVLIPKVVVWRTSRRFDQDRQNCGISRYSHLCPRRSIAPISATQGRSMFPFSNSSLQTPVSFARWSTLKLSAAVKAPFRPRVPMMILPGEDLPRCELQRCPGT